MTFICKCCSICCGKCAQLCQCICEYCFFNWFSIACFGCFCCLLGMAVMLLIIYLYYSVAVYPGATIVPEVVYQYEQEYPMYKRESKDEPQDTYAEDNYYDEGPGKHSNGDEYEIARNKRDNQTSTATPSATSQSKDTKPKTGTTQATSTIGSRNPNNINASTSNPYHESGEEDLDFKLSNSFVNSIHAEAERNRIKEPLGLCRNNEDIKTPEMNITLFPLEQAQEIIACINDILKNQSKKHLCIELNEEMNAFLKWLILTGESKERRKQIKISAYHDDFLFPSTCGTNMPIMDVLTGAPGAPGAPGVPGDPGAPGVAAQPPGIPVGPAPLGPPVATKSPAQPADAVVLTTCAPVLAPGPSKKGGKSKR